MWWESSVNLNANCRLSRTGRTIFGSRNILLDFTNYRRSFSVLRFSILHMIVLSILFITTYVSYYVIESSKYESHARFVSQYRLKDRKNTWSWKLVSLLVEKSKYRSARSSLFRVRRFPFDFVGTTSKVNSKESVWLKGRKQTACTRHVA